MLKTPVPDDMKLAADAGEQVFLARSLGALAWTLSIVVTVAATVDWFQGRSVANSNLPVAFAGVLFAWLCLRAGRVRLGWGLLLACAGVTIGRNAFASGGLDAPHVSGFLVMLVVAGRMLGPRWAVALAVALSVLAFGLARLHALGLIPPSGFSESPYRRALVYVQMFVALGVFCWYAFKRNQEQIAVLQRSMARQDAVAAEAAQARRQFEAVFRGSPAAMALYQADVARTIDCNDAYLCLLDRSRAEVLGHTGLEMGMWRDPNDRARARAMRDRGEPVRGFEFDLVAGNGELRRCALNWSDVEIDGKQFVLSHIADLTHRYRAEQAVAANEQRFQDFAHASGDWFWETDAQGRFVWLSDSVAVISGMTAAEHYGKTRVEFAAATDDLAAEPWKSHLESLERREPFRDFRYLRKGAQGAHWISISGVPCFGAAGEFRGYRGAGADVSASVDAEHKASHANTLLRAAVEDLHEAFLLSDPQGRIVVANRLFRAAYPAMQELFEQESTIEQFLRTACAHGYFANVAGREEAFIAGRMAQLRDPGPPFERRLGDGTVILVRDLRLSDGSTITTGLDITERKRAEDELRTSRQLLEQVIDALPMAIFVKDLGSNYRMVNSWFAAFLQSTKQELLGRHTSQVSAQEITRQNSLRDDAWVFENRQTLDDPDMQMQDSQGRAVSFHSTKIPLFDAAGALVGLLGINRDITEDKRAQEALRASRQLLEQVIDAIPMSIFVKDLNSTYLLVNKYFADLHHTTRQEFMGRHTSMLPSPDETRQKSLKDDAWVFQNRQTLDQPDTRLQDSNGRWIAYHSTKIPLFDADGAMIGLMGLNRDITEGKRAEQALRDSEARFAALFQNSYVPQIVSHPQTGSAEQVNEAFLVLCGHPLERLLPPGDETLKLFASDEDRAAIARAHANGGTVGGIEIGLVRADGEQRTVLASAFTISTPAGPRIAWSMVDVTEQRAAQMQLRQMNEGLENAILQRTAELTLANTELQTAMRNLKASQDALLQSEKLAALGRIVAGVAHELNTPIGNSLLASTTLTHHTTALIADLQKGLRRSTLDNFVANAREAAQILERNLERAAELIRSFKQVAVDQTSSQRRAFDLRDVVGEVVLSHRPGLRNSGVEIRVDIPSDIGLDSFPGPLGQVVGNLINNAVLHGYEGRTSGLVTIAAHLGAAGRVVLSVSDHGRGIPAADLPRVFDPFFTTRFGKGGSGLGLNIVHNIVTGLLGGTIAVESAHGAGARFSVNIPRTAPG